MQHVSISNGGSILWTASVSLSFAILANNDI